MNQLPTRWRIPRYREGKPTLGRVSQRSLERVGAVLRRLRFDEPPPNPPQHTRRTCESDAEQRVCGAMAAAAGAALEPTRGR